MASNKKNTALPCEQQKEQVDSLITCVICLQHFVDPRILPCSHTYCFRCIQQAASANNNQFDCPLRDGTKIDQSNIDALPINRAVCDMVEILPTAMNKRDRNQASCSAQCAECQLVESTHWCEQCGNNYCSSCCSDIHTKRAFASHQPVLINENPPKRVKAEEQSKETSGFWCHTCETFVCHDSLEDEHEDHDYGPISQVAQETKAKVKSELEYIEKVLDKMERNTLLFISEGNIDKTEIAEAFASLRDVIDECERSLEQQALVFETTKKVINETQQTQLQKQRQQLENQSAEFTKILSTNEDTKLLQARKELLDCLEKTKKQLRLQKPPVSNVCWFDGLDQLRKVEDMIQKRVRLVEHAPLPCCGRACSECKKCRDWYYDKTSKTCTHSDLRRRNGYTCNGIRYGRNHFINYDIRYHNEQLCQCDNT